MQYLLIACLVLTGIPLALTRLLMEFAQRSQVDPHGLHAYEKAKTVGQNCFGGGLLLSLPLWLWCGFNIAFYKPGGGWIDLGPIVYIALAVLPVPVLLGVFVAWLSLGPPKVRRDQEPEPEVGFTRF